MALIWACVAVIAGLAFFLAIVGLVFLILYLAQRSSGLSKMVARYGASGPIPEPALHHVTVQIGSVRWRRVSHVAATSEGLHLGLRSLFFERRRMLIPWADLGQPAKTMLYLAPAMRFPVGTPVIGHIVVPMNTYRVMQPFLT